MMKTEIIQRGETIIVDMDGMVDYESQEPFRESLTRLVSKLKNSGKSSPQIIFNFEDLEFVGSSGISTFVHTLKSFGQSLDRSPKYCNVRSEFRRIMNAFDENREFEFFETIEHALIAFESDTTYRGVYRKPKMDV